MSHKLVGFAHSSNSMNTDYIKDQLLAISNEIEGLATEFADETDFRLTSASGKSNGGLFVSAKAEIKKITNIGNKGMANHSFFCATTISIKFNDPTQSKTVTITKPIDTS